MVGRGELTDAAWAELEPLLPRNGRRGQQWRGHRTVVNGILWRLRTGAPWRDLPERYGPWRTAYARFALATRRDLGPAAGPRPDQVGRGGGGGLGGRRRQHRGPGAPARRGGAEKGGGADPAAADEALGRSRGGLTTKLHLACDGKGRPLSVVLTPGQRHDSTQPEAVLDAIRVPRPGGKGRPRRRPDRPIGDKGYSYERCRRLLRRRGIPHVIPERDDQRSRRAAKPGRKPAFDREAYRRRNVVERCVNRLKQWRGIATRFEKRAAHYRAMVVIAALVIWLGS